jgi:hypothetical protein
MQPAQPPGTASLITAVGGAVLAAVLALSLLLSGDGLTAGRVLWAVALILSGGVFALMAFYTPVHRRTLTRVHREVASDDVLAESIVWRRMGRWPKINSWYGLVTSDQLILVPSAESRAVERRNLSGLRSENFSAGIRNAKLAVEFENEAFELRSVKEDLGRLHAALRDHGRQVA